MKEKVQYLFDSFIDFKGEEHKFVICAVSQLVNNNSLLCKKVTLGFSICNPGDEFNEEFGTTIAYNRAKSENCSHELYVSKSGMINTKLVSALLEQEAEYLKRDPNSQIKGYREAENKFHEKQKSNFSNYEKEVLKYIKDNPNKTSFLEKIVNTIYAKKFS